MSLLSDIKKTLEYHESSFRVLPEPARKDLERILCSLRDITEPKEAVKKSPPQKANSKVVHKKRAPRKTKKK